MSERDEIEDRKKLLRAKIRALEANLPQFSLLVLRKQCEQELDLAKIQLDELERGFPDSDSHPVI